MRHVDPGGAVFVDLMEDHVAEELQQVAVARLRPVRVHVQSATVDADESSFKPCVFR